MIMVALTMSHYTLTAQSNFTEPASEQLIDELNRMDSILFKATFEDCRIDVMAEMITDDVEFYHDKGGLIATSADILLANLIDGCERQKTGQNNKAKREVILSSIEVYPLANYGAIHRGKHLFYQLIDGQYQFTESAQFSHVWRQSDEGWKLARILSFDHRPTK